MDFTVTQKGLEEQLLGRVIGKEQKALEEQLSDVLEEVNSNTKVCPELLWPPRLQTFVGCRNFKDNEEKKSLLLREDNPIWKSMLTYVKSFSLSIHSMPPNFDTRIISVFHTTTLLEVFWREIPARSNKLTNDQPKEQRASLRKGCSSWVFLK